MLTPHIGEPIGRVGGEVTGSIDPPIKFAEVEVTENMEIGEANSEVLNFIRTSNHLLQAFEHPCGVSAHHPIHPKREAELQTRVAQSALQMRLVLFKSRLRAVLDLLPGVARHRFDTLSKRGRRSAGISFPAEPGLGKG